MKKIHALTLILVLVALNMLPALAVSAKASVTTCSVATTGSQTYALAGYITEIDTDEQTMTVEVMVGNRLAKPCVGSEVVLVVVVDTRLQHQGGISMKFTEFKVGQSVSSNGTLEDGVWTAERITEGADLVSK